MARRGNHYGYREYRGRSGSRARTVLLFIIALLVVVLIAGVLFMIFLGDYLEYTDDGVQFHPPWMSGHESVPPEPSDPLVIESEPVDVTVEPDPSAEPSAEPTQEVEPIAAVTVTVKQLRDGAAANAVTAAGGNALVVEMKTANGKLNWQSQADLAAQLRVDAADNAVAQAVWNLAQEDELYLIARIPCFRDPVLAKAKIGTLMTKGGNIWYDGRGVCWSSPACADTVDYLSALCLELADMGFDEILLDYSGYPNFGEVHVLATNDNRPEDLAAPVSAFYERLSGELDRRDVRLSVFTDETLLPGEEVRSGITAAALAPYADRVWLDAGVDAGHYADVLTAAGMENAAGRLVVPAGSQSGNGSWYQ